MGEGAGELDEVGSLQSVTPTPIRAVTLPPPTLLRGRAATLPPPTVLKREAEYGRRLGAATVDREPADGADYGRWPGHPQLRGGAEYGRGPGAATAISRKPFKCRGGGVRTMELRQAVLGRVLKSSMNLVDGKSALREKLQKPSLLLWSTSPPL